MSDDETMIQNQVADKGSMLLEPEDNGIGDYIIPGLVGLAGAVLIYASFSRKKDSKDSSNPKASVNEVKFSKGYSSYDVGKDWEEMTLEPYLAEQAEEGILITSSYVDGSPLTVEVIRPSINESRDRTIADFSATHKVSTLAGETLISKLPSKPGVEKFNEWLSSRVEEFQEEY